MKVVTWNLNSVRARHDRLLAFLERESPDVLCLQELKCVEDAFPHDEVKALGYRAAVLGQPTYNGVAIVAKDDISDVRTGVGDDELDDHARLITAEVRGVTIINAYMPNGGEVGSDKYAFKLRWMDALTELLKAKHDPGAPTILTGDFNCAPADIDVAKPEKWAETVLCHRDVRERVAGWVEWGFVDVPRRLNPDEPMLSWWDYRRLAFPKGDGLRIDHVFATEPLAERAKEARVDREERKGKGASDHAPVIAEFDVG